MKLTLIEKSVTLPVHQQAADGDADAAGGRRLLQEEVALLRQERALLLQKADCLQQAVQQAG